MFNYVLRFGTNKTIWRANCHNFWADSNNIPYTHIKTVVFIVCYHAKSHKTSQYQLLLFDQRPLTHWPIAFCGLPHVRFNSYIGTTRIATHKSVQTKRKVIAPRSRPSPISNNHPQVRDLCQLICRLAIYRIYAFDLNFDKPSYIYVIRETFLLETYPIGCLAGYANKSLVL